MSVTWPAGRRAAPLYTGHLFATILCAAVLLPVQGALAQSPLNPYSSFTDSGPITPEEKARREQVRTELYERYSADYRLEGPLVSEASIAALEAAIQHYQQIAAAGGWPAVPDKVTLRPGD